MRDGTLVAIIDTIGSQANRIEPMFAEEPYSSLVPQVNIQIGAEGVKKSLFSIGHRAADAFVRYSDLRADLDRSFELLLSKGDFSALAKIAPTSILFGMWDSREGGKAKIGRLISSTIRAFNVEPLSRSAQYTPPIDYANDPEIAKEFDLQDSLKDKTEGEEGQEKKNLRLSEFGLASVPDTHAHGGVIVRDSIRRETILNLASIRNYGPDRNLRDYLLALGLVAIQYPLDLNLRQGCLLVRKQGTTPEFNLVNRDGTRVSMTATTEETLDFAREAAKRFGVGANRNAVFDAKALKTGVEGKHKPKAPPKKAK
jgi:CRISPR-associated protein Csb1